MKQLEEGDHVRKVSGYAWPGKIVSVCLNGDLANPETRYVVRLIAPGAEGALHIFSGSQIEVADAEAAVLAEIQKWLGARGMVAIRSGGERTTRYEESLPVVAS